MCAPLRQSLAVTVRALIVTISLAWTAATLRLPAFHPDPPGGHAGGANSSQATVAGGQSTSGTSGVGALGPAEGPPEGLVCIWMVLSFVLVQVARAEIYLSTYMFE